MFDIYRKPTRGLSIPPSTRRNPRGQKALITGCRSADRQEQTGNWMRLDRNGGLPPGGGAMQDRRFKDRRVMLVQSGGIELRAIAEMISVLGYHVTPIEESGKALLYFGREPCEVVVSELEMLQINGYQLAQHIRRHSPHTRILLMTACCQAEVVDYMDERVVDGWLFKPFGLEVLKNMFESTQDSNQEAGWTI